MNEVVWSLIGLLAATTFGNFYWVGSKMDSLGARLEARIDGVDARVGSLGARLEARIDGVDARIDALDVRLTGRLDALTARMDTHLETHHG